MSHFTVVVAVKDIDDLDAAMAPFDENREVPTYRDYETGDPKDFWATSLLREENGLNPNDASLSWAQIAEAYNARYGDDGERYDVAPDGRMYTMSTRNPDAKWDYWRIGGRWGGYFTHHASREAVASIIHGERGWDSPSDRKPMRCEGGPKWALDLDAMREERGSEAAERYDGYHVLVGDLPEAQPFSHFRQCSEAGEFSIERARELYRAQERVQAVRGTDYDGMFGNPISEFSVDRRCYVERARAGAVPGYATLTLDGRWLAPGRMGWFGTGTDDDSTRAGYAEIANGYIDDLPDDVLLVALDCHI